LFEEEEEAVKVVKQKEIPAPKIVVVDKPEPAAIVSENVDEEIIAKVIKVDN
jgi:hypothetical protein